MIDRYTDHLVRNHDAMAPALGAFNDDFLGTFRNTKDQYDQRNVV